MLTLLLGLTLQTVLAQRCTDYVSVDGKLLNDAELGGAVACYFGDAEGTQHAYVRTDLVTAALGLESDYLPDTGRLLFEREGTRVELAATDDVAAALAPRPDALTVAGEARRGRSAVLAGSSFVPLAELVGAFGGATSWNAKASLVVVDFSAPAPAVAAIPTPEPEAPTAAPTGVAWLWPLVDRPHRGPDGTFTGDELADSDADREEVEDGLEEAGDEDVPGPPVGEVVAVEQQAGGLAGGDRGGGGATDPASGLPWIAESALPAQARQTLALIRAGGPYPYPRNDDKTFGNRERLLPREPSGYYREYTVITPGEGDRGARRIITGREGEKYWTADHYDSFSRIREGS